jgi:hypothetical protein
MDQQRLKLADFVAKVGVAGRPIFRENTIRETIADLSSLNRITEVAREFNVRR